MRKIVCLLFALFIIAGFCSCHNADVHEETQRSLATGEAIDFDLTVMSGTVVYSQVYDMVSNPRKYEGKIVKMNGEFSAYYSDDTKLYYPAVIVADATACCSQGMEFVLAGEPDFPAGYPQKGSEITVIGVFKTYYEGQKLFCHLVEAKII